MINNVNNLSLQGAGRACSDITDINVVDRREGDGNRDDGNSSFRNVSFCNMVG